MCVRLHVCSHSLFNCDRETEGDIEDQEIILSPTLYISLSSTHLLTHLLSLSFSLTLSLIHSLTHSFTNFLAHPLTHPLTHSLTHQYSHPISHTLPHSQGPSPAVQAARSSCWPRARATDSLSLSRPSRPCSGGCCSRVRRAERQQASTYTHKYTRS